MKINTSDKLIAWLTLLSGLSISAVAVWYSVAGLVSIFAAAAVPIMIMGVALEVSKLVATVWLKMNWKIAPKLIRTYLITAITILMLITSMGIFGFLSKAHLDQAVPTGDIADKVALIDEKIKTQKENVDAARKALKQMDESVDQVMARSTDEKGADKAAALRRGQQRERSQLQNDIAKAQKEIASLNEERAPISKELRKVEAEVGPIKYIAALLYGDNPDQNILEKAVRWVIIIIVIVFDPLAVVLLLASQYSFQWFRKTDEDELAMGINAGPIPGVTERPFTPEEIEALDEKPVSRFVPLASKFWPFPSKEENYNTYDDGIIPHNTNLNTINNPEDFIEDDYDNLNVPKELEDHEILDEAEDLEAKAMTAWKHDNPNSSLKLQRRLFEKGVITKLPWEDYLKPQTDYVDQAAEEAKKWANENPETDEAQQAQEWADERLDERPGDYLPEGQVSWMEHDEKGNQIKKTGYQQNAEQGESTIWQRIKKGD